MSIAAVHARIAELQSTFAPKAPPAPPTTNFAGALQGAVGGAPTAAGLGQMAAAAGLGPTAAAPALGPMAAPLARFGSMAPAAGGTPAGQAMLGAARAEVGVAEQPPGSNDSPRIAHYRQATAGSAVNPWCAYFVSWAARQAGAPVGEQGQGFGSVDALYSWAQRAGKATPAGPGAAPQPGDIIVWDEHIGLVENVLPDGSVQTIEGNSSHQVARRTHPPGGGGAVGYVRLG